MSDVNAAPPPPHLTLPREYAVIVRTAPDDSGNLCYVPAMLATAHYTSYQQPLCVPVEGAGNIIPAFASYTEAVAACRLHHAARYLKRNLLREEMMTAPNTKVG